MLKKSLIGIILVFFVSGCAGEMGQLHGRDVSREAAKPYRGIKKRIAVTSFVNKARGIAGSWNIGEGLSEMLTTELIKTGRFVVVERQALRDILAEQELGQTGLVSKATAAKVGQILGAQILVKGVVSEFEQTQSGGGGGFTYQGLTLGVKTSYAHVAVDIRLIDATTGQILHSHNSVGKAESSALTFGLSEKDIDFTAEGFQKTPLGQATRQAIHNAVEFIINTMEQIQFTAKVVKNKEGSIYINAGSLMNMKPGDRFNAYSKGGEFIDPDTGLSLGSEETFIGTVEIVDVKKKYSIARLVSGKDTLKRGDIIKGGMGQKLYNISAAARPYYDRGQALYNKGDYKGAEAEFRKALNQEPGSPLYHNWLGVSLRKQGNYNEAISHYRRALQSEPDDAIIRGNLAFALERTGGFEEAKAEYEAVLRLNPDDRNARKKTELLKIIVLEDKGDIRGANSAFQAALNVVPEETQVLTELDILRASRIRAEKPQEMQGWLGANIMAFGPEDIEKFRKHKVLGVPNGDVRGMLVLGVVAGSAAEATGLRPATHKPGAKGNKPEDFERIGDIITEIDGQPALGRLLSYLASKQPGDTVSIVIIRDGRPQKVTVILGSRPN